VNRRDQILATAADLFATKGFHGVSVGEIGKACGVSGPALYKHFESKDAVLAAMLVGISERLLEEGRTRVAGAGSASQALESLVAWHIDFALTHRSLIVVQDRDWQSLRPTATAAARRRRDGVDGMSAPGVGGDRATAPILPDRG
jgi:AcrR family transcriptional regulator